MPDSFICRNKCCPFASTPQVIPIDATPFTGFPTNFSYQFKLTDPSGTEIAASAAGIVDALPDANYMHKVISTFPGLIFNGPGSYNFSLDVNAVWVGSIVFQVHQINVPQPVGV